MDKRLCGGIGLMMLIALNLSACSAGAANTPEPDRVGTRVAEELAVSQTLTAVAKQAAPPVSTEIAQVVPTATAESSTSDDSTPTVTLIPPTPTTKATDVPPTRVPATRKPTVVAPKPPTPTKAAAAQQADPYVPGGGNFNGLIGKIYLPGYGEGPKVKHPSFNEEISIQLAVHDPNAGDADGAGIKAVEFSITDPNGDTVWKAVEQSPRYCAFGGDAGCAIWSFPPKGNRWPNGKPVCKGDGYQAQMTVRTTDPDRDNALWQFNFAIEGDYPPCS